VKNVLLRLTSPLQIQSTSHDASNINVNTPADILLGKVPFDFESVLPMMPCVRFSHLTYRQTNNTLFHDFYIFYTNL